MKILNINSYYYSSTVHRQLQNAILSQDIDSLTYAPLARGYVKRDECQQEMEDHVHVSECYNNIDRYIFHLKHKKILNDIKRKFSFEQFSYIHAHSLFSNGYIALGVKEQYGLPYIVAVRATDVSVFFRKFKHLRSLGIKILKEAQKIVFLSGPFRDDVVNEYIPSQLRAEILAKSDIIPNGIDKFWLDNKGLPKVRKDNAELKLLYIGAISKRKNLQTAIQAINILQNKGYNVSFTVVGKIVEEKIYNDIKSLPYVNYISPQPKEKLLDIYRQNDIYLMPSITETFGLVYAEAMSQGLPVIYTRGQGFDGHFVEGEVGYSVDCFNAGEIATNIVNILDKYEQLSENCIRLCDRFDWDKISKTYIQIYKKGCVAPAYKK